MSTVTKRPKRAGLTKVETWKRLSFVPADQEGKDGDGKKYRAMCLHCQKCQANTSIDRLIIHRYEASIFRPFRSTVCNQSVRTPGNPASCTRRISRKS